MAGGQVVVGLDVGTSKVCTVIAEVRGSREVHLVGVGVYPSRGLKKGVVVDMDEAAAAVAASLKKAEVFSGYRILGAYVAVSGGHLDSELVRGDTLVVGDRPVSRQDMAEALESAQLRDVPEERQVLHMIARGFVVDGENGIRNPVGMRASRLGLDGLAVTAGSAQIENVGSCVGQANIQIDGFVSAGLASAQAVLSDTERDLGVLMLDIGAGTTDLVWFRDSAPRFVGAVPLGGNQITNDISVGLGVPFQTAEEMKLRFASALPTSFDAEEMVDAGTLPDGEPHQVSRRFLAEIVEARVSEIFDLVTEELKQRGFDGVLPGGVVLTGGTAQLRGIRELAARSFDVPVRVGLPEGLAGASEPIETSAYATAAGLLLRSLTVPADIGRPDRPARRREGLGTRIKRLFKAFLP